MLFAETFFVPAKLNLPNIFFPLKVGTIFYSAVVKTKQIAAK